MLKKWLNKIISGKPTEKLVISPEEETLSGLNLKEVLDTHNAWKVKLQKELSGDSNEEIDVIKTAKDDVCVLGKWIYGSGKNKHSELAEYESARKAHKAFHLSAAEVVIEHQSGNTEQAQTLLKTKFRSASNLNQIQLVRLFSVAKS